MKTLQKYLLEKLLVNKDMKSDINDDTEYDLLELVHDVIMHNFALWSDELGKCPEGKLWKMNKITMAGYLNVANTMKAWLKDHNVDKVHCRNVTFIAGPKSYEWIPDKLQDKYLKIAKEYHWPTEIKRLCYIAGKFAIYAVNDENNDTLDIIYWRGMNNITLACRIHI